MPILLMLRLTCGFIIGYCCVFVRNNAILEETVFEPRIISWQYAPYAKEHVLGATADGAKTKR